MAVKDLSRMVSRRGYYFVSWLALLMVVTASTASGEAGGGQPGPRPAPDPGDGACVEPGWPNYYYRLPVIFQDISEVGTLQFVGFGYADACKDAEHGKGSRGATHANIMVYPGVWQPDILQRLGALGRTAKPPDEALPGLASYPGDNAYRWQLPAMPVQFPQLYNEKAASACKTDAGQVVCPGIAPEFGEVLAAAGFKPVDTSDGTRRFLIEADIEQGGAKATKAWFGAAGADPFYGRFWAAELVDNHSAGGVLRVILHPVNLTCDSIPATTPVAGDGTALLQPRIGVYGSRAVPARLGWRVKANGGWQGAQTVAPGQYVGGGANVSVPVSGVKAGQVLQVMINYDRAVNEVTGDEMADVYGDNVCETTLVPAQPSLKLHDLWYSPAPPKPGDAVRLSVGVTNDGAVAADTSISWSVDGVELGAEQTPVAVKGLGAGADRRVALPGSFAAPKAPSVKVQACITGTGNCVARDVLIQLPPAVTMTAPSTWPCQGGDKYWVT